jgi:uncharacterized protein YwqG
MQLPSATTLYLLLILGVIIAAVLRHLLSAPRGRVPTDDEVRDFLADLQRRLAATRRPVARIALEPMGTDDPRVSKVGGRPFLPPGATLPCDSSGRPLALLAQINWRELDGLPGCPQDGLLQVWIARDGRFGIGDIGGAGDVSALSVQGNFRLLSWPAATVAGPLGPADLPMDAKRLPFDPNRPRRMRFTRDEEVMSAADFRFDAALGTALATLATDCAAPRGLDPERLEEAAIEHFDGAGHKIGGYPTFTQEDPRSDPALDLLLQLDSDDGMEWGDAGVASFFITPEDLVRGCFERVLYSWDCT